MIVYTVGIVLGSTRTLSNTQGFSNFLVDFINSHFPSIKSEVIHLSKSTASGHPLPLLLEARPPAAFPRPTLPGAYDDEQTRQWSKTVLGWDGAIILTPQYNWSVPAPLKNALDHLYNEWPSLPCSIVTLGGHGGSQLQQHLRVVCGQGLHMKVVEKGVEVSVPLNLMVGKERITGKEIWLKQYEPGLKEMLGQLLEEMKKKITAEEAA